MNWPGERILNEKEHELSRIEETLAEKERGLLVSSEGLTA
jgi:hypothetical protein